MKGKNEKRLRASESGRSRRVGRERESEGIFRGDRRDGVQCNLGAKDKATVVHVATVLRTLLTSRCGLLSPSLI